TNVRRIQRYLEARLKLENEQKKGQKEQECSLEQPSVTFFASLTAIFRCWLSFETTKQVGFGY
ncbi:MAG: hypothetical protein WAV05_07625, partial [Anaerolineales bacterium]